MEIKQGYVGEQEASSTWETKIGDARDQQQQGKGDGGEVVTPEGKVADGEQQQTGAGKGKLGQSKQQGTGEDGEQQQGQGKQQGKDGEQADGDGDQQGEQQGQGSQAGDEQDSQGEQDGEQQGQGQDNQLQEQFAEAISQMTEDQKMSMLQQLSQFMDEDKMRRIAYAVFKEEYSGIAQEIEFFTNKMKVSMDKSARQVVNDVLEESNKQAKALLAAVKAVGEAKRLKIELKDGAVKDLGTVHKETEWLIKLLQRPGRHAFLTGPAGSGKTTCAEKVAEALGIPFHPMSVGPETMKSDLLGFVDANGNYHTTQVREAFEKGGLLLLDEMDAGNGASMTILNSLLANGYCAFPDGIVKRHPNFRCIAAANTFGRGADRVYVGRNQLDGATLDRFVVRAFDYDEALERRLAGNDEWVKRVQEIRKRASELKLRVVVSPRASIMGAGMLEDGFTQADCEEALIFKYDVDFRRRVGC